MNKKKIRRVQMRLGKNYRFFTKIREFIKRFIMPDLMEEVKTEKDVECAVRLIDLLNDAPDVGKDVLSSLAEIQIDLLDMHEKLDKLLEDHEDTGKETIQC